VGERDRRAFLSHGMQDRPSRCRFESQVKEASGVVTMDAGLAVRAIADVNCSSILACAADGNGHEPVVALAICRRWEPHEGRAYVPAREPKRIVRTRHSALAAAHGERAPVDGAALPIELRRDDARREAEHAEHAPEAMTNGLPVPEGASPKASIAPRSASAAPATSTEMRCRV
jgi:hypothetical protein